MFSIKKDKIIYIVLFVISVIGIATGINYQKTVSNETIKLFKKSFEFGLYNFFFGESFFLIFFSLFFSLVKHFVVFSLAAFWWWTYPLIPLNLFGIGFKMGIVMSFVISILKINGLLEIIALLIIVFFIMFVAIIFCKNITDKRIKLNRYNKIDYTDIRFILISGICVLVLTLILIFLFFLSKYSGLKLYGLFTTFL